METPQTAGPTSGPTPPPPVPPYTPRPRELRRRPDEGIIGGVCAGLAEYFGVDPVIVRIAAVVLAISGPGVIAYLLAWIFVPAAEGPATPYTPHPGARRDRGAQILGIVLLAIAVSVLWGDWWSPARRWMFPLGLIALGTWLLLRRTDDAQAPSGPAGPASPTGPTGPAAPPPGAAPWAAPRPPAPDATLPVEGTGPESAGGEGAALPGAGADEDATLVEGAGTAAAGEAGEERPSAADSDTTAVHRDLVGGRPPGPPPVPGAPYGPPPGTPGGNGVAHRRRGVLTGIVMGALFVWAGIAWLAGVSVEVGLAIALCIVGVGFVLGAFVGGAWGLAIPAVLIGAALVFASIVDLPLSGPIGTRTWTPDSVREIRDDYELSIGEGVLDLTGVRFPRGGEISIEASVGIGHLVVEVPEEVAVEVTAEVSGGETDLLGHRDNGMGVSVERSFAGDPGAATVELDLEVGFGQIEVRRVATLGPAPSRR